VACCNDSSLKKTFSKHQTHNNAADKYRFGGMIMTHGDDDGVIMPPRVAPAHVVLLPIFRNDEERTDVMAYTEDLATALRGIRYHGRKIVVEIDDRDTGGARGWEWVKKGIPLRAEIGPKDMANDSVFLGRRDKAPREKTGMKKDALLGGLCELLDEIQDTYFQRAKAFMAANTLEIDDKKAFYEFYKSRNGIHGGFALSHWCGNDGCEAKIKEDLSVTIRCIPFDSPTEKGECICCGNPSNKRVLFSKAY